MALLGVPPLHGPRPAGACERGSSPAAPLRRSPAASVQPSGFLAQRARAQPWAGGDSKGIGREACPAGLSEGRATVRGGMAA